MPNSPEKFNAYSEKEAETLAQQKIKENINFYERLYRRDPVRFIPNYGTLEHCLWQIKRDILKHYQYVDETDPSKLQARAEEIAQEILRACGDKTENLLPIYDRNGNLWWPKQMSYEEVKKFAAEREATSEGKKIKK